MLLLSILLLVLSIVVYVYARATEEMPRGVSAVPFGAGLILLILSPITTISAGHKGVLTYFGQVQPTTLPEGMHWINPLYGVIELSARVEREEESHQAETSDTQSVTVRVITNWRPNGEALASLYKNYGLEYPEKIIPPAVRESIKAEVAKYKVTELISKRPEIHQNVQASINQWLSKYDLQVLEVAIAEIDFSEKYDTAIEAKQVQEQQALQKKYELDRTVTEAQMAAAQAKGEADSQVARAMGEAEALKIRGIAQADFNLKVAESLSPMLIQMKWMERWDGQLPVYSLGQGADTMLMLPSLSK